MMNNSRVYLRTAGKWIVFAAVVFGIVYRIKFSPTPVIAQEIKAGPIAAEVMGTGTLEARVKTTISSRIQERLAQVLVDQGDCVTNGQLLALLDDSSLKQQVEVAQASLAAARAGLERVKTDVARAVAVEDQARLEYQRVSSLATNRISSQADLDKAVEQLNVAGADVKRSQAAIVEAESQVVTANATLSYQKERLSETQVLCPYNGLIVRRDRDPGGVVVPGASLLQLISTNEIWVSAWVDETAMAGLAPGQPARVVLRSEPTKSYPGEVARLGRETDRETREFLVDVLVKELPRTWTVGQRAEVFIQTGRKSEALLVPQSLVRWKDGKPGVFVNDHGRAAWRAISIGLHGGEKIEVTQGVSAGEQVLKPAEPKQELAPGQRISIQ
jgi:HlyD family secretion protein